MPELVGLALPAGPGFVDALLRVWDDGDVAAPLPVDVPEPHLRTLLEVVGPDRLVTPDGTTVLPARDEHRRDHEGRVRDGDAVVVATSGTTGRPRAVVHTHQGVEWAAYATATALGVAPDVRWLACLPLHHVGGLSVLTRALSSGAGLEVVARADPETLATAVRNGCTHVSLVPTLLGRIDPSPWRRILLGGSAPPLDRPDNTVATYGCTETFGGVVYDGLALNGVSVRTATPPGTHWSVPAPIELRTPSLGRADRDGAPLAGADGWYRTGDIGVVDPDTGRLDVTGRADDVVVTGGENVWPQPVERVLAGVPGVAEVAVVGRDDPEWGQRVVAVVVPTPGRIPTLEDLRAAVRAELPAACAPRELDLRDSLPRTALGKIERYRLRAPSDRPTAPPGAPST